MRMVLSQPQQSTIPTDSWVNATWEDYLAVLADPALARAKGYYYNGKMRLEMSPVGNDHASDHSVITYAVHLFAGIKNIDLNGN